MIIELQITEKFDNKPLKNFLLDSAGISKRLLNRLKNFDKIRVNGKFAKAIDIVHLGDIVTLDLDIDKELEKHPILAEDLNLEVIFQDDSIIAINKRPHMVMHPVSGHQSGTVANGVAHILKTMGKAQIIHPINRLDRDTSGVVLIALNSFVQENLIKQMKAGTFVKQYLAVIDGCPKNLTGTINAPIDRAPNSIMNRQIHPNGAHAITHYKILAKSPQVDSSTQLKAIAELDLETGRTHQIRVHLQHIGCPIIGDSLYHKKSDLIQRQALHSRYCEFEHPITKKRLALTASLPKDIINLINFLNIPYQEL